MAKAKSNRFSKKNPASHTEVENARHDLHQMRKSARAERQRQANADRMSRAQVAKHAVTPIVPLIEE